MRAPMSDRALRRIVADLAAAAPEDVDEVLEGLTPDQSARVRRLLADYLGASAPAPPSVPAPQPASDADPVGPSLAGLSDWLVRRFEEPPQAGLRMTLAARTALRACIAEVQPPAVREPPPATLAAATWRDRLAGLVRGRGQ